MKTGIKTDTKQERLLDWVINGMAVVMIAYHAVTTWHPLLNDLMHQNVHLGFALVILLLFAMKVFFVIEGITHGCNSYIRRLPATATLRDSIPAIGIETLGKDSFKKGSTP